MKLAILIVACLAIVAVQSASIQNDLPIDDYPKPFLQRFALEIIYQVDNPLQRDPFIETGIVLDTDQSKSYISDGLLPLEESSSIKQGSQLGDIDAP